MSGEEVFVQQFAKLFIQYRDALTLNPVGEQRLELQRLNEMPAVELDRMISAARLAVLEIENNAREQDGTRHYYARRGEAEWDSHHDQHSGDGSISMPPRVGVLDTNRAKVIEGL